MAQEKDVDNTEKGADTTPKNVPEKPVKAKKASKPKSKAKKARKPRLKRKDIFDAQNPDPATKERNDCSDCAGTGLTQGVANEDKVECSVCGGDGKVDKKDKK